MTDEEILRELEPEAERLLNRHLASAEEWYPHEQVPWDRAARLETEGFIYGQAPLCEGVRSALLVNLLTEDNLPWYRERFRECLVGTRRGVHGPNVGLLKKVATPS